ncbi:MAG: ImmA/IrrE family metallo-endopeptidase [Actinobacteria bacterium]|uniref:Unannotated protein n=1 Tax=freshwater metagenome TaxID=449393 RepID=A0A6J5ZG52_9ZZZZ|nr:ImmA/IrrE family metallo-endopeptidase [Actinomycetota bacterium]
MSESESDEQRQRRHEETAAAALAAREQCGVPLDEPIDCLLTTVERSFDLAVVIADLGEGIAGCLARRADLNLALLAAKDAAVRRRFTLAHELGHFQLGHGPGVDTPATLRNQSDPKEAAANQFAAEFIAPQPAVERFLQSLDDDSPSLELVCRVSNHFAISAWSARIRLESVGVINDPAVIRQLDSEIFAGKSKAWYERLELKDREDLCALQGSLLPRLATVVEGSAYADYANGRIGSDRLARAIGSSAAEVDELLGGSVG